MENRYKLPHNIQLEYFSTIETKTNLPIDTLANILGVTPRSYRDWKSGKFTIPQKIVNIVKTQFNISLPGNTRNYLHHWKKQKHKAAIIGGIARTTKHGPPGTTEGRIKGGRHALIVSRKKGLIPFAKPFFPPDTFSESLAEFIGILLGDGHLDTYQWSISLNATKDKIYSDYVVQLIYALFRFKPSIRIRKNYNVIIILGSGLKSVQYLTKVGFQTGNKVKHQVGVPQWIKNNSSYRVACLRGLIDTDGGIFNNSYKVHNKKYSYIKLAFANSSIPLLQFVFVTLQNLGFNPTLVNNSFCKRVWLGNQQEVKKYLLTIGTHNPRLYTAINGSYTL